MIQSLKRLCRLLLLTLAGAVPAFAEEELVSGPLFTPVNQRYPILSQQEFLGLSPERQREYILVLRDFVVEVGEIAPNGMPATARTKWEIFLDAISEAGRPDEALAAGAFSSCSLQLVGTSRNLSLTCEGSTSPLTTTSRITDDPEDVARRLLQEMKKPGYTGPVLAISEENLAQQIGTFQQAEYDGTSSGQFRFPAPVKKPAETVVQTIYTGGSSTPVTVHRPAETPMTITGADPFQTLEKTDKKGEVVEKASNMPGQETPVMDISAKPRTPSAREIENASMAKLGKMEDDYKKPLRCIYAGFAIRKTPENDDCAPVGSFMSEKSKKVFACEESQVSEEHKKAASSVVLPKKKPKGKVVLCNPLVFGTDKAGEPFCVPRNAKATESCRYVSGKSSQKEASLKSAIELARENPMSLSEIRWTYEKLCSEGNEADLKTMLAGGNYEKAKADLAQTCNAYGEKLASFPYGGRKPTSSSGRQ